MNVLASICTLVFQAGQRIGFTRAVSVHFMAVVLGGRMYCIFAKLQIS